MIDDLVPAATRPCEQERDAASFFLLLSLLFFKSTAARIAKASMEHTKPQDVRIQGYQDVTQDFRAACQGESRFFLLHPHFRRLLIFVA